MSTLAGIFKRKTVVEKKITTLDAINKLKETIELLEKKTTHIENKVGIEIRTAKENGMKNKRLALTALKRKRRLEKQLAQIDGTISTLEFQVDALENANTNVAVFDSMKYASEALKNAQMDPDDAHDIMDDIAEQKELQDEISQTLSSFVQNNSEYDDDELLAELKELEGIDEQNETPENETFPEIPDEELPSKEKRKKSLDDDMKGLSAWAS